MNEAEESQANRSLGEFTGVYELLFDWLWFALSGFELLWRLWLKNEMKTECWMTWERLKGKQISFQIFSFEAWDDRRSKAIEGFPRSNTKYKTPSIVQLILTYTIVLSC